ncbi:hypothetical protein Vretimale_4674 [Volvox reticuliferus]|uniref:Tafazzin family protein n=1 Tax=Volvox reticuliferus TaxID=1737510 RepID=A0A8J4FFN5_9CHLO|nr:hypothetical protein Vretifemale_3253 [Volvox reticuliferus]GIL99537.1 hypothetical protein Vretimale_4674 [Volvox reticuliferus]
MLCYGVACNKRRLFPAVTPLSLTQSSTPYSPTCSRGASAVPLPAWKRRWTLCASDRCFRYQALVPLFRAAKVLPVVRGGGLAQPGMVAAESRLAAGDWVHIFPEGTRSPDGVTMGSVRKGIGRLVASLPADAPAPMVVPFVHRGMEDVMPRGAVLPAVGQQIDVLVGEPIAVADLLSAARAEGWPADRLHTAVAARVAHGLKDLRRRLDARRAGLPNPGPSAPEPPSTAAVSALDQFDHSDLALADRLRAERRRRGGMSATWERLKSRMALQHRTWATQGVAPAAERAEALAPCSSTVVGTMAQMGLHGGVIAGQSGSIPTRAGLEAWSSPYVRGLMGLGMGVGPLVQVKEKSVTVADVCRPEGTSWFPLNASTVRGTDPATAF